MLSLFELQAGFLITNAVRFIFKAPGIASWQYSLLQLQVKESFELHSSCAQSTIETDLLPMQPASSCHRVPYVSLSMLDPGALSRA